MSSWTTWQLERHGRVWGGMWCVAALAMVCGCQWKGGPGAAGRDAGNEPVWRISPTNMRIYPSSEFHVVGGQPALEARIELFDEVGDSTKGVGDVRFELYTTTQPGASDVGKLLYQWEVPMRTKEQNREYYDVVTRSYGFQLRMDEAPAPGKPLRLVAEFVNAEQVGKRLSAEATLTPQP